jgi:hypothetical protein
VRRGDVVLAPGDRAAYRVYLPAGAWSVRPTPTPPAEGQPATPGAFGMLVDGGQLVVAGPGEALPITTTQPGWHLLALLNGGDAPETLQGFRICIATEAF